MTKRRSKVKLGDVLLDAVVVENPDFSAEVTKKPVESGQDISDYMKQKPIVLKLSGSCVYDAANKHEKLRNYLKNKELIKYHGRGIYSNAVITTLNTRHNADNAFGFDFDITLTCVRIAKPKEYEVKSRNPEGGSDEKTTQRLKGGSNVGRKQLREHGEERPKTEATKGGRKGTDIGVDILRIFRTMASKLSFIKKRDRMK